ncbi:MaoC family dehydratase [Fodinicurvata halophila]|uniref:MaoC family dehydratase n=1 Tax=Fodinicurvata halophila TaxID=1419723 RepID=UPI00363C3DD2
MAGLRYEQFEVGMVFDHEWSRTVTEADNVMFSTMTMNPQPLHLDAHFAATTEFHRPLVNSLFTLGLMIGMSVNDTTLRDDHRQPGHVRRASRNRSSVTPSRCAPPLRTCAE